ncbi:MAG TPA: HAD family hydrolase [Bacteroidota bacterium]|nr:HAD family hydrolase [Bacteroidota bacterium]
MLDLLERSLNELEERLERSSLTELRRIAAFDLDGTLLEGDIGEAVFGFLLNERLTVGLSWEQYQHMLGVHKSMAYKAVVSSMAGAHKEDIAGATSAVMNCESEFIRHGSARIRVPRPRPILKKFLALLRQHRFRILVLSASNHFSVQQVTRVWFDIPASDAFGIQSRLVDNRLTTDFISPLPIGPGKAVLLRSQIGESEPLITGSDSALDLPLLRLTHPYGFSIWVGNDRSDFDVVRANAGSAHRFVFLSLDGAHESDGY